MRSGVFLERDGVLNRTKVERGNQRAPLTLEEFKVNRNAIQPLKRLKAAGYVVLATTNQPGLSCGYQSRRELDLMHDTLRRELPLDDILMCPHDQTDHCTCRKPQTGLFTEAAFKWHLDLERSFVISDKWQDARAAHVAGCTSLMIQSPWIGKCHHDFVLESLADAVEKILQLHSATLLLMDQV